MEKNQFKRTFTRAEVEEYVKKMLSSSEITMCEQKDRIIELKKEIDDLKRGTNDNSEKFKMMSKAMNEATKIAKEAQKDHEIQMNIMIEKVRQFGYKWVNYFKELIEATPQLKGEGGAELFSSELSDLVDQLIEVGSTKNKKSDKVLPRSRKKKQLTDEEWLGTKSAKSSEVPEYSLSDESEEGYKRMMSKLKNQMVFVSELQKPAEGGFNIDEALNPKDSLDKIIGDLI